MKFEKVRKSDWYKEPKMVGHIHAKEMVEYTEEIVNKWTKDREARQVAEFVINWQSNDWHYFACHLTKQLVLQLRKTMRRIGKSKRESGALTGLLYSRHNVAKDRLDWFLELFAYKYDREMYEKAYINTMLSWGMRAVDSIPRFHKYHQSLMSKRNLHL